MAPILSRLSQLLIDEKSLKLFTLQKNRVTFKEIMDSNKLCIFNLASGVIGRNRSSMLSGLINGLINNTAFARASIPFSERKPVCLIKDEFHLGPGDLESQLTGLRKFNISIYLANQFMEQIIGRNRDSLGTVNNRVVFNVNPMNAEYFAKEFGIDPGEITGLQKHQAFVQTENRVIKVNTPKPWLPEEDYSEEIKNNCLEKYYLRHEEKKQEKQKLTFDVL